MGNPLLAREFDKKVSAILNDLRADRGLSLRALQPLTVPFGEIKLTRLGDILTRGKAMTLGELETLAAALNVKAWELVKQAELAVSTPPKKLAQDDRKLSANELLKGYKSVHYDGPIEPQPGDPEYSDGP